MIKKSGLPSFLWITIACFSILFLTPLQLVAKEVIVAIGDSITQADTHWTVWAQEHDTRWLGYQTWKSSGEGVPW